MRSQRVYKHDDNRVRETIRAKATEFRDALNSVSTDTWNSVTIRNFPRGACGHCSELLARYLTETLGIAPLYASGRVSHLVDGETHAWLEHAGLFIDISADQFGLPAVIVENRSPLHEQAEEVDRHPIIEDHWWARYAAPVYREAVAILTSTT